MTIPSIPLTRLVERRARLLAQLPKDSVAIIPAAKELTRSRDTEYLFRQDSYFYYLTGFNEPDALLVLKPGAEASSILFCRPKNREAEIWQGRRLGNENASETLNIDEAYPLEEMEEKLCELMNGAESLYFADGLYSEWDTLIQDVVTKLRNGPKKGWVAPSKRSDLRLLLDEMRLFKDEDELAIMRQAAEISAAAHCRAMEKSYANIQEFQLEAEIHHEFARKGARSPAYNTIVGGGANACILHYTENQDSITDGELVLIDAGCELDCLAADITRTFPVNGRFTDEQKAIYQIVLDAMTAALEEVKPGSCFANANEAAIRVIIQGLLQLDILKGELEELIKEEAQKPFFMHGIGHWLGLDVHDVGDYKRVDKRHTRSFEPGMVLTIEPGIYIDDSHEIDSRWHNIGVRIEDNVIVTKDGHENITSAAPKDIAEIESLMKKA